MKFYVLGADGVAGGGNEEHGHHEGLDPAIKILVIDGVFIMVEPGDRARHLVGNKGTAIDSRRGLDRLDGRSRPGIDGRGHSHGGSNRRKAETGGAADIKTAVGCIVEHVALPRVGLAPGILVWGNVLRFGEVGRTRVHRRVQIVYFDNNPMRRAGVSVAGVVG